MSDVIHTLVPLLLSGLKLTVLIAVVGILCGFVIGSLSGYALQSHSRAAHGIAYFYIWIIRGTPIIVQALYVYYVIPSVTNINLSSTAAGILVITLNSGAFISEIVRGALESVDGGQREAGASLGLTGFQILTHIVIPPAFRSMVPALFNQFIISLKDTAMLTIIVVNEMTQKAMAYSALTFDYVHTYTTLALFYLVLITVLMLIQKLVEKKIGGVRND